MHVEFVWWSLYRCVYMCSVNVCACMCVQGYNRWWARQGLAQLCIARSMGLTVSKVEGTSQRLWVN